MLDADPLGALARRLQQEPADERDPQSPETRANGNLYLPQTINRPPTACPVFAANRVARSAFAVVFHYRMAREGYALPSSGYPGTHVE